jgi:signal transduction histidine kinase
MEHQFKTWSNIIIEMDLPTDLPPISCNHGQIAQILINLLTNARDAMPAGGRITIQTGISERAPNCIFLKVSDTGSGIPEDIQGKIFDPFFTTKPQGMGTGLGLSIISGIVRAHGADISVKSRVKQGTTFTICFHAPEDQPE